MLRIGNAPCGKRDTRSKPQEAQDSMILVMSNYLAFIAASISLCSWSLSSGVKPFANMSA